MRSRLPKHLHPLLGRRMVDWVVEAARPLEADPLVVVASPDTAAGYDGVQVAVQEQALGTGDAVRSARAGRSPAARPCSSSRAISRSSPPTLLRELLDTHRRESAAATVLTFRPAEPGSYGRIVRDESGALRAIVEAVDATPEQLALGEVNSSIYAFDARRSLARAGAAQPAQRAGRAVPDRRGARPRRGRPPRRRGRRARPVSSSRASTRASSSRRLPPACATASTSRTCSPASRSSIRRRRGSSRRSPSSRTPRSTRSPCSAATTQRRGGRAGRAARRRRRHGDRDGRARRPLLLPAPGNGPRGGVEGGHVRRDQELPHRRADEGAAPLVPRRRRRRRGHEHRRGRDHRKPGAPARKLEGANDDRARRQDGCRQCLRSPRHDRRRRMDSSRIRHHGRCASRSARDRPSATSEQGRARWKATVEQTLPGLELTPAQPRLTTGHAIPLTPQKRLMVVRRALAHRARRPDRRAARRRARRDRARRRSQTTRPTAATASRSAAPTSSSSRPAARRWTRT